MLGFRTMTTPNFKIAVFWLRIMVNSTPHEATIYLERHYLWKHMKMHICMQLWSGFICLNGVLTRMVLNKTILPLCCWTWLIICPNISLYQKDNWMLMMNKTSTKGSLSLFPLKMHTRFQSVVDIYFTKFWALAQSHLGFLSGDYEKCNDLGFAPDYVPTLPNPKPGESFELFLCSF